MLEADLIFVSLGPFELCGERDAAKVSCHPFPTHLVEKGLWGTVTNSSSVVLRVAVRPPPREVCLGFSMETVFRWLVALQ